jgi:hypothetical protein
MSAIAWAYLIQLDVDVVPIHGNGSHFEKINP